MFENQLFIHINARLQGIEAKSRDHTAAILDCIKQTAWKRIETPSKVVKMRLTIDIYNIYIDLKGYLGNSLWLIF
jgi:mannosyltransferase OCH1-like enzyme